MHGNVTTSATAGDPVRDIRGAAGADARIGFVSGNFNVVHPGHLRLLTFARENSDFLVVNNPLRTRWDTLAAKLGWAEKPKYKTGPFGK